MLDLLPKDCVFDGELVVLGDAGRPLSTSCCSGVAVQPRVGFFRPGRLARRCINR
jgi:hypothetical protein